MLIYYYEAQQDRPVAMGWHGVANVTPGRQDAGFFATPGKFFAFVYCCFISVAAKERRPEIVL